MSRTLVLTCVTFGLALCASACTDGGTPPADNAYRAFSEANYQAQKARVGLYQSMLAVLQGPSPSAVSFGAFAVDLEAQPTVNRCTPAVAPAAGTLADLYLQTSLCQNVVGRVQQHSYATGASTDQLGQTLHSDITLGLQTGASAQSSTEVDVAGERVVKTLLRFFYEAIYDEMTRRTPKGWDEAFGYFGTANDSSSRAGLAAQVAVGDAKYSTSLEREIFVLFLNGRVALADGLARAGKSPDDPNAALAPGESADLDRVIQKIDEKLLLSLAYAAAGEWNEWVSAVDDRPAEYVEGTAFTRAIADYLRTKSESGYTRLSELLAKPEAEFVATDAEELVSIIESAFGIQVAP